MDWFRQVNGYCERTGAGYWSEPVNALTNIGFIVAAALCWRMLRGDRDPGARVLAVLLVAIGVGSWLFHTHAQVWALMADVVPIQLFILAYLYLATTRLFAAPPWLGALAALVFIPCASLVSAAARALVGPLNGSVGYLPVPLLIAGYGLALRARAPATARGLLLGAGLLALSLAFRTADAAVCPGFPLGTHFVWHLLNAAMLGWMIRVLHRHAHPAR